MHEPTTQRSGWVRWAAAMIVALVAFGMLASAPAQATPGVDLTLDLTNNGARFTVGQNGTLQAKVRNTGTVASSGVVQVETGWYYTYLHFVSASGSGWSCAGDGNTSYERVLCQRSGAIAAGAFAPTISLVVAVQPDAYSPGGGVVVNGDLTNDSDANTGNNTDSETTPLDAPDPSLMASAPATMTAGVNSTVGLTVKNDGTLPSSGSVTVTVPAYSLNPQSGSGTGWTCGFVGADLACGHTNNLAAGASLPVLNVVVRPGASDYPNGNFYATLTADSASNPYTGNDYAYANSAVNGVADLSIQSAVQFTNPPVTVGTNETATIDVSNVGSVATSGTVSLDVSFGTGLTYVSKSGTGWTCGTGTGSLVCTRTGAIASGAHAPLLTLTLSVTTAAYPYTYIQVSVQNGTGDDPSYGVNGLNNYGNDSPVVDGVADLRLDANPSCCPSVVAGSTATVALSATAASSVAVAGTTTISVPLPTGVTLEGASGSGWSCPVVSGTVTCTRSGTIAAGGTTPAANLTLRFDASLANTSVPMTYTLANSNDVYPPNDTVSTTWFVQPGIDLYPYFGGTTPGGNVQAGQSVAFTLNVQNGGTDPSAGTTTVTYTVPSGLTYVSRTSGSGFTCSKSGAVVTCTRGTAIAAGASVVAVTLNETVSGAAGSTITHCVDVANPSDANSANNSTCTNYQVASGATPTDLTVSTGHNPATFSVGSNGTVTAFPSNVGDNPTTGTVTAALNAGTGLSILSASATNWSCAGSGASVSCTTTATAAGHSNLASITAIVSATAAAVPSSTVTATVSGGGDSNAANNSSTETIPVSSSPPVASFTASPTLGIAPVTVSFNGTASSGGVTSYAWNFGDGATATGSTTSHSYTTPGVYNAVLTVTGGGGQQDSTSRQITVGTNRPINANAGDDIVTGSGASVVFNGSGSEPSPGITSYQWDFGDGTSGTGAMPTHTYTNPGPGDLTRTVTLTVAAGSSTDNDTATVLVKPTSGGGSGALTVTVTNSAGGAAISGAALAVVDGFGNRYQAASNGAGQASIVGLPNGAYTLYAYASTFKPKVGTATVANGTGTAAIALDAGPVGATTVESRRLTYDEIVAAGIDPADPANNHVYEFTICLSFDPSFVCNTEMTGMVNEEGTIFGGEFSGGGGGCTSSECTIEYGGFAVRGGISFPAGPNYPVGHFLLIPGEARWLKEFFEVKMVTTNLSPSGFTFTDGTATLDLPDGMSLAPTGTPQSLTQSVLPIPGGGGPASSKTSTWIVRGDEEGDYNLSAEYTATLDPVGAPIHLTATASNALKVWAGAALQMTVRADSTANLEQPYRVRIGLTNVTSGADATDVYNPVVELKKAGATNFVYQPLERLVQGTAVIQPGQTFWTDDYVLLPAVSGTLQVQNSFVFHTGGDTNVASTIGPTLTPVPALSLTATGNPGGVHLSWAAKTGATGYRIFKTTDQYTQFTDTPEATVGPGVTSIDLPEPEGLAWYTVSSTVGGIATTFHPLVSATALPVPVASIGDATVVEGSSGTTKASVTVRLSKAVPLPVTLRYDTADGTATTSDYSAKVNGTLTIPANATSGVISISGKGDVVDEPDETFTVALSNPTNATIGRPTGTVTILDDDPTVPSRLSVGDVKTVEGSNGTILVKANIIVSPPSASAITVNLVTSNGTAVAPGDYTTKSTTVSIPANTKSASVGLTVTSDTVDEADETFALTLSNPTGATIADAAGTVTILDDDPAAGGLTVSVGDVAVAEGDLGAATINVAVVLSAPAPAGGVTVHYATADYTATTAGADYTTVSANLLIAAGKTSAVLPIDVTGGGLYEPDEAFIVTLSAPTNGATLGRSTGTVTIQNDDPVPVFTVSVGDTAHIEGAVGSANAKLTVTLSAPSATDVTVHYTMLNGTATGSDYTSGSGTVTILAGTTTATINVSIKGDATAESDETMSVILDTPVGATIARGTGTVTVLTDD